MMTIEITALTDEQLVGVYRELRARRDAAKEEFSKSQEPLLTRLKELEAEGNRRLLERGSNSFATDSGTCYKSVVRSYTAPNKSAFLDFVRENQVWDLVDARPAKAAVDEYVEEHGELPPGLSANTKINTNFTAPRKK